MKLCQYIWDYVSLTKQLYNLYNSYKVNQDLDSLEALEEPTSQVSQPSTPSSIILARSKQKLNDSKTTTISL